MTHVKICPICGAYMNPYFVNTAQICWRCSCGYDSISEPSISADNKTCIAKPCNISTSAVHTIDTRPTTQK